LHEPFTKSFGEPTYRKQLHQTDSNQQASGWKKRLIMGIVQRNIVKVKKKKKKKTLWFIRKWKSKI